MTAFESTTGRVVWMAGGSGFFASPIIATLGGVRQVISTIQGAIIGVSPADGTLLWQHPWKDGQSGTTPAFHGDAIVVAGAGEGMLAVRPRFVDGRWTTEPLWQTKDVTMYVSNPVVVGDAIYGLSSRASGQYFAIDAASGKTLWLGAPRAAENAAAVKAGGILFLLNDRGELIVAKANRDAFTPVRQYKVAGTATWTQPAISGNRIFVKDASSVTLWTLP